MVPSVVSVAFAVVMIAHLSRVPTALAPILVRFTPLAVLLAALSVTASFVTSHEEISENKLPTSETS